VSIFSQQTMIAKDEINLKEKLSSSKALLCVAIISKIDESIGNV